MSPQAYEELVCQIVSKIYRHVAGIESNQIHFGKTNRLSGISGYHHQIDVSIHAPGNLILIECKKWKNPVTVSTFLTHLARIKDIEETFDGAVHGAIVTYSRFQSGVLRLAKYYRQVGLVEAQSLEDYLVKQSEMYNQVLTLKPVKATLSKENLQKFKKRYFG